KYISQNPILYGYHFTFQRIINQIFVASLAINSELVKNDKPSSNAGKANTIISVVVKSIEKVAGAIPGLNIATNILTALIEKGMDIGASNELARLASIAPGPSQMEQMIERISRRLTITLENDLLQLKKKPGKFPMLDSIKQYYS